MAQQLAVRARLAPALDEARVVLVAVLLLAAEAEPFRCEQLLALQAGADIEATRAFRRADVELALFLAERAGLRREVLDLGLALQVFLGHLALDVRTLLLTLALEDVRGRHLCAR